MLSASLLFCVLRPAFSLVLSNIWTQLCLLCFLTEHQTQILGQSESKRLFGGLPVVCIWITVLMVLLSPTSIKSEVQLLPGSWDKKSWWGRGCPSIFWNINFHKIRNLWERQEDTKKCIWKRAQGVILVYPNLGTQAWKSIGYHKVLSKMMRLNNTVVKIEPDRKSVV